MAIPPEVKDILLLALFNPATLAAGYWCGRHADQIQKIVVGGFVAGLAGTFFAWLVMRFGTTTGTPKLLAGIFVVAAIAGLGWARLGFWVRQQQHDAGDGT